MKNILIIFIYITIILRCNTQALITYNNINELVIIKLYINKSIKKINKNLKKVKFYLKYINKKYFKKILKFNLYLFKFNHINNKRLLI